MRKLLITLDDDLDTLLTKVPNQNETTRNALRLYFGDISTPDTIEGLRVSYLKLFRFMQDRFERYDESFKRLDKLINYLETRM